jgi:hypothetical protein
MTSESRAKTRFLFACVGGAASACAAPALGQGSFHAMPFVPFAPGNLTAGISADGNFVAGQVDGAITTPHAVTECYRYAIVGGYQGTGDVAGGRVSSVCGGISPDGVWVFGNGTDGTTTPRKPFRWSAATGIQTLPLTPNGIGGSVAGSSFDGSIMVGSVRFSANTTQSVRWTPAGVQAITGVSTVAAASDVTPDGAYVAGIQGTSTGQWAYRWSPAGGLEILPAPSGVSGTDGRAISNDGSVIMGKATLTGTADDHYFRWTAAMGPVLIMDMPGRGRGLTSIWDMNADGSAAVGTSLSFITASNPDPERAVIWDVQHGVRDLNTVAAQLGINLDGYHLNGASAISDDGLVITGHANRPGFASTGYILRLAPYTQTGACCLPDGTCAADLTTPACVASGGISWAASTPCAQANCPQPGACCKPDAACVLLQPGACASADGLFAGAGVACAQANCPDAGACCSWNGSCSIRFASLCAGGAGLFRGPGTACGSANCPSAYAYSGSAPTIPDGSGTTGCGAPVTASIVVNDSFPIASADASFFVFHTFQGDLRFTLRHVETGTAVRLVDRPGQPQTTYGFDNINYGRRLASPQVPMRCSDSGTQVYDTPPPGTLAGGIDTVSGLWRPENSLAPFVGESSAGTWQLVVEDCAGGDIGTFTAWTLNLGRPQACYPNCDSSTTHPILNVQDFSCFLGRYAAGDPYANCDGSTALPTLNVGDFTCYLQKFAAGCR